MVISIRKLSNKATFMLIFLLAGANAESPNTHSLVLLSFKNPPPSLASPDAYKCNKVNNQNYNW